MRMWRLSPALPSSFQPWRAFSCMVETTKRPSGEKTTPVCAPFHSSSTGAPEVETQ